MTPPPLPPRDWRTFGNGIVVGVVLSIAAFAGFFRLVQNIWQSHINGSFAN